MPLQLVCLQSASELMQGVSGMCHSQEFDIEERRTEKAGRHACPDHDISPMLQQGFIRAGQHDFSELDTRLGCSLCEPLQRLQQQRRWKRNVDGQPYLDLAALLQALGKLLQLFSFVQQL